MRLMACLTVVPVSRARPIFCGGEIGAIEHRFGGKYQRSKSFFVNVGALTLKNLL